MPFASTDEITQHYAQAINRAGDNSAAVVELRAEEKQVLADFRLHLVEERERKIWVREAVHDYPLARSFPQLIEGQTEEQVRESAKTVHEQLSQVFTDHQRDQEMRKLYEAELSKQTWQGQNPPTEEPDDSAV